MKIKTLIYSCLMLLALLSCDETTGTLGTSLSDNLNKLNISTDTFYVKSVSKGMNSVINKSNIGYLGYVKDPQTGEYITGEFLTQFHISEDYTLPELSTIVSKNPADDSVIADSCEVRLYYRTFFGDSLATMKTEVRELSRPIDLSEVFMSNFDPIAQGFIRTDGLRETSTYTLVDQHTSETERNSASYINHITIPLNGEYVDKSGKRYSNFGTYVMQTYYEHPEYFRNSIQLINNVIPGFYFEHSGGIGSMAYVTSSALNVYFRYTDNDSTYNAVATFSGTEEVLQASRMTNNASQMEALLTDKSCTYLKTPAGLYTELTLPIDEILIGHENDTINAARLVLPKIIDNTNEVYKLPVCSDVLILPADSIDNFFANNKVPDNKTSFITSYSKLKNTTTSAEANSYTFNNISSLITYLARCKREGLKMSTNWLLEHPNWNKVAVIPVTITQVYDSSTQTNEISKVTNNMSLSSVKLLGGNSNNLKLTVVYSKF